MSVDVVDARPNACIARLTTTLVTFTLVIIIFSEIQKGKCTERLCKARVHVSYHPSLDLQ